MKNIVSYIILTTIFLTACNSNRSPKSQETGNKLLLLSDSENVTASKGEAVVKKNGTPVNEIISAYLELKNALVKDNSAGAAAAGTSLKAALTTFNKTLLTADQKKTFEAVEADVKEHAEHIGESSGNIKHQREHFEMLSNDIYDLAKALGSGQVLYKDFCPMYNNGKGAYWLSETKDIQNPYYGKEMLTCGSIKEELH